VTDGGGGHDRGTDGGAGSPEEPGEGGAAGEGGTGDEASADGGPGAQGPAGERWAAGLIDDGPCPSYRESKALARVDEKGAVRKLFSSHGYVARTVRVERVIEGKPRSHCVRVAWPPGRRSTHDKPVRVAARIDDGWLRGIENTLARLPWRHLQAVRRVVIDNHPTEHGIAPFDRRSADDGRDGHTLWLHERLFTERNHWAHGNHGAYWSYHVDIDGKAFDDQPADHALFSPVLLHEIGHLVAYNVVNGSASNEAVPACARVCGDDKGGCKGLSDAERERGCISAYCMPFRFETGTENWAEQYRFYYQSALTRSLLAASKSACFALLDAPSGGLNDGRAPPWTEGLSDIATFQKTRWKSCGERACKDF
jgi:hypothetical protein